MRTRWPSPIVTWLAVSLVTAPLGLSAEPQPPPLPPTTVDQMGLRWDLKTLGKDAPTKPFRYSLCQGRYLQANEVSSPCNKPRDVNGGHEAPYTFSAGHGTFLPKGLSIDGNGILEGNDPKLLAKGKNGRLSLCVRQLDVERCKPIQVGKTTVTEPDNIAKALGTGAGAPKAGNGVARTLVMVGGLGLATGGIVVAASGLKSMNAAASCVTAADVAASAPGYMTTSGPNTACTVYTSCGGGLGLAVCLDLTCDSAFYYYRTSDGKQFPCATAPAGAAFTLNTSYCGSAAANAAVRHCTGL